MCDLGNKMLASGSFDSKIHIWASYGEVIQTLIGHTKRVQCLCVWKDKLVSGSYDKTIRYAEYSF